MKHCSWCDNVFNTQINYQIYCSTKCRDDATKEKIAARYLITRRQKRIGKDRKCKNCKEELSIYNDDSLCNSCNVNPSDVEKALKEIKRIAKDKG
jgi:hypothetical protein